MKAAHVEMDDESLLDMQNLEIIITALGSLDFLIQRRLLSQAEHCIDIALPFRLGKCAPKDIS